jgi:hypothetical protein
MALLLVISIDFSDSSKARKQNVLDDLSNSGPAVRLYREGRPTGPPEDRIFIRLCRRLRHKETASSSRILICTD